MLNFKFPTLFSLVFFLKFIATWSSCGFTGLGYRDSPQMMQMKKKSLSREFDKCQRIFSSSHSGRVFCIPKDKMNYENAKSFCKGMGATLAAEGIRDDVDNNLIQSYIGDLGWVYIGLDDLETDTWKFADGVEIQTDDNVWSSGQPNNPNEHCGVIKAKSNVHDIGCDGKLYAICEQ